MTVFVLNEYRLIEYSEIIYHQLYIIIKFIKTYDTQDISPINYSDHSDLHFVTVSYTLIILLEHSRCSYDTSDIVSPASSTIAPWYRHLDVVCNRDPHWIAEHWRYTAVAETNRGYSWASYDWNRFQRLRNNRGRYRLRQRFQNRCDISVHIYLANTDIRCNIRYI